MAVSLLCRPKFPGHHAQLDHLVGHSIRFPVVVLIGPVHGRRAVHEALDSNSHVDSGTQGIGALEDCTALCILTGNGAAVVYEHRPGLAIVDGPGMANP